MTDQNLSLSQIALELSISQATLSNWQARYSDFPEPAAAVGNRRLYRLKDIRDFVARRGLNPKIQSPGVRTKEISLVQWSFDLLRGWGAIGIETHLLVSTLAVIVCETPDVFAATTSVEQFRAAVGDEELAEGLGLLDRIPRDISEALLSEWRNTAEILDRNLMARVIRTEDEDEGIVRGEIDEVSVRGLGAENTTPKGIAKLVVAITSGLEFLDMCSGTGRFLSTYGRTHGVRTLIGQEKNPQVALLSRLLARIEGFDIKIHTEDSLRVCHDEWIRSGGFHAVFVDPPMGLKLTEDQIDPTDRRWVALESARRTSADDFWIQSALAYLRPSDTTPLRAVVLLRAGWFFEDVEKAMRAALVKRGHVEAIISLGSGLHSRTGISVSLLVLRKTTQPAEHIRMIDASEAGKTGRRGRDLRPDEVKQIAAALEGKATKDSPESVIKVYDVSIGDVLSNDAVLDVQRYAPDPTATLSFDTAIVGLQASMAKIQTSLSDLQEALRKTNTSAVTKFAHGLENTKVRHIRLGDAHTPDSPVVVLTRSRKQGVEWTTDDILRTDVVVSALGVSVGRSVSGGQFLDERMSWGKIWILRARTAALLPNYLLAWARHGGLEPQLRRRISGTNLRTIAGRDFENVTVPVIDRDLQESVAAWGDTIDSFTIAMANWSNDTSRHLDAIKTLNTVMFSKLLHRD